MNSERLEQFDVVVVGGGPGGSTVATLVAMRGHKVLLLEKECFPRYQIGESLLPSTVHGVCRLLGVADEIADAGFMPKHGGAFRWGTSPEPWVFDFTKAPELSGLTVPAYQVERMKFDTILLNNARKVGVCVRENCSVTEVVDDGNRIVGVRYADQGEQREARARFIIDASGNKSNIYRSVGGVRHYSEFFRNLALFGYFEGGKRLPPPRSGNILCEAFDSGWFWYIPLTDSLTSVGAVVRKEMTSKVQGDPDTALRRLIAESSLVRDFLEPARRVTSGPYGQLRVRKDYSYCNSSFWRTGMALVGDAACFIDPVFSSGVHLATYSALLAARSINSVLAGVMDEERSFQEFEARYRREYGVFYEFLVSFYDLHVSEQSYFWQARKVTNAQSSDLEAFVKLVGGVASREAALIGAERATAMWNSASSELAAVVKDVVEKEGTDLTRAGQSWLFQEMNSEGMGLIEGFGQVQSPQEGHAGPPFRQNAPLFADGLVVSEDGMHWALPRVT